MGMKGEHITLRGECNWLTSWTVNVEEVVIESDGRDWTPLDEMIDRDEAEFALQQQLMQQRADIGFWHWVYHHDFG
jgi:hypothetical protein